MMFRLLRPIAALCGLLLFTIQAWTQDSTAIKDWKAESKKTGEKKYELTFSATVTDHWQLYAPNQLLFDAKTTELKFPDSNAVQQGDFALSEPPKQVSSPLFPGVIINSFEKNITWKTTIAFDSVVPAKFRGTLLYTYAKGEEFYPSTAFNFTIPLEGGAEAAIRILIPTIDIDHPVKDCGDSIKINSSYWAIFLLGFLGGLIALLTPCVFPMIPLTVTFFTKKTGDKSKGVGSAILYGFFIFLIYILITVPFHIVGHTRPEIFNNISTNVWLNLIFFIIFIVFALSFFGLFEITLPSSIANKADAKSGLGNIAGIFFMALTLAIVSFSCTGPILGTLLAGVVNEGAWPLTAGAAGFGVALGLPFALFALFPQWLQSIPKSGGWMTDVKVVLGFVEVALAVKFLATADNVMQWGLMKREIFIGLWAVAGICIVLYLLGWLRIGHSTRPKRFSAARIAFIVLFLAITAYLIPGVTNTKWAKLNLISGFPPPTCYSIYKNPVNCERPLLDYEEALKLAKKENKPILIDFTGWGCTNCRRMEENVWTAPEVQKLMREEYILVSLYVDEKSKLPSSQQLIYTTKNGDERSIVRVGDRWATFQTENFKATSQPQYALISPDEIALTKPKFYTPDPHEYAEWLRCGLEALKEHQQKK